MVSDILRCLWSYDGASLLKQNSGDSEPTRDLWWTYPGESSNGTPRNEHCWKITQLYSLMIAPAINSIDFGHFPARKDIIFRPDIFEQLTSVARTGVSGGNVLCHYVHANVYANLCRYAHVCLCMQVYYCILNNRIYIYIYIYICIIVLPYNILYYIITFCKI